jgi:hypothetical protein
MRMAVRLTSTENVVALYDSTTGLAFGPIFDSDEDAIEFLEWLEKGEREEWAFERGDDMLLVKADARIYRPDELDELKLIWSKERENAE